MALWAKGGVVDKFFDAKEWQKFCVGEAVGRAVDTEHYIAEGKPARDEL
jgi:hypothetical protein